MADLPNDSGAIRFVLTLVAREGGERAPGGPAPGERVLSTAGLEYLDARDGEWWPLVRLPPVRLEGTAIDRLLADQSELLRGSSPGFAWRPAPDAALALQLGATPGGAILEVGLDLGAFLADAAGVPWRSDSELALFRFRASQASLVRFADALARELEVVRG